MEKVYIRMLGEFSLQAGDVQISDHNSRSRKVWLLLAYLVLNRNKVVSRNDLLRILGDDIAESNNPESMLKIVLHRTRTMLNQLWPTAGHDLIQYKKGGYSWNSEIPVDVDVENFEAFCKCTCDDDAERMRVLQNAVALYRNEFLTRHSSEMWVMPLVTYYHNLYMKAVVELVSIMSERGWHQEVVSVCRNALLLEAYHEPLHRMLMQAMLAMGDYRGTVDAYEKMRQKMREEMGVDPEEETVALYMTALQTINNNHIPMEEIQDFLKEDQADGALQCDYDYFKVLCHAEARTIRRSGSTTHIALLTLEKNGKTSNGSDDVDWAAEQLGEQIRRTLRQSDSFARCSRTQYIVMLPQANYENSQKVCERIIAGYIRNYPNLHVKVHYQVKQLLSLQLEGNSGSNS